MPKIIRIQLTQDQSSELNRLSLLDDLASSFRLRLEMVRLSDVGPNIIQIATALHFYV